MDVRRKAALSENARRHRAHAQSARAAELEAADQLRAIEDELEEVRRSLGGAAASAVPRHGAAQGFGGQQHGRVTAPRTASRPAPPYICRAMVANSPPSPRTTSESRPTAA